MNAEAWLISHLSDKLGIPAYGEPPEDRPSEFVTVERVGGPSQPWRDMPTMAVQCWAQTAYAASELARRARDACLDYSEEPDVSRVSVSTAYRFNDPDSGQPRYQLTVDMTVS